VSDSRLTRVTWQWNGLLEGDPATLVPVAAPHDYQLTLDGGGSYHAKADCNVANGRYTQSEGALALEPGAVTRASCGPESLSGRYLELLAQVEAYELRDGGLVLHLAGGAGALFFDAG
jgi:heat shock protein HslJ